MFFLLHPTPPPSFTLPPPTISNADTSCTSPLSSYRTPPLPVFLTYISWGQRGRGQQGTLPSVPCQLPPAPAPALPCPSHLHLSLCAFSPCHVLFSLHHPPLPFLLQNSSTASLSDVYGGRGETPPPALPTCDSVPFGGATVRSSSGNQVGITLSPHFRFGLLGLSPFCFSSFCLFVRCVVFHSCCSAVCFEIWFWLHMVVIWF